MVLVGVLLRRSTRNVRNVCVLYEVCLSRISFICCLGDIIERASVRFASHIQIRNIGVCDSTRIYVVEVYRLPLGRMRVLSE